MTTQELELEFRQALAATVALAQASDLRGDVVGYHLQSLVNDVSHKWNAELDRRNAQHRMAGLNSPTATTQGKLKMKTLIVKLGRCGGSKRAARSTPSVLPIR